MKDSGSFYNTFLFCYPLHSYKMATAASISYILNNIQRQEERKWVMMAVISLNISLFMGRKVFLRNPLPGPLLGSIGQDSIVPKLNHQRMFVPWLASGNYESPPEVEPTFHEHIASQYQNKSGLSLARNKGDPASLIFRSCKGHIDTENALSTKRAERHSEPMLCSKVLSIGVYLTQVSKLLLAENLLFPSHFDSTPQGQPIGREDLTQMETVTHSPSSLPR